MALLSASPVFQILPVIRDMHNLRVKKTSFFVTYVRFIDAKSRCIKRSPNEYGTCFFFLEVNFFITHKYEGFYFTSEPHYHRQYILINETNVNPSVTKGISTHIGYQWGSGFMTPLT